MQALKKIRIVVRADQRHSSRMKKQCDMDRRPAVGGMREAEDQREVKLELTAKGEEVMNRASTPARGLLPGSLQKLNTKQLCELNKGLQVLLDVIERADESPGMQPLPFAKDVNCFTGAVGFYRAPSSPRHRGRFFQGVRTDYACVQP